MSADVASADPASSNLTAAEPLLLVGAGKMGGAMLGCWLESGLDPRRVAVLDPAMDEARRSEWGRAGLRLASSASELSDERFATIILAVKPQVMSDVLPAVAGLAGPRTLVISVAAGIRLATLEAAFPSGQPIVRVMPNTPAQVGQGMSVALANASVPDEARATVTALMEAVGKLAWIEDETLIDAVTAVSGSGPAYVFLLAEALAGAARRAGLPDDLAAILARQTVTGAGALLGASELDAAELRRNVTSPNGTTAAALAVLMAEDGLQPLLDRAVEAARRRSVELG